MSSMPTSDTIGAYVKVEAGEEFTITKHGTPVARLVPIKKELTTAERRKSIEAWINQPDKPTLGGLKIRDLINKGRR